ncbi:hypothetical protein JZ751_013591 [Albula glossodonta]|uniref:Single stranded DNA binding protein 4 n=1 Tax=Albula glossodonta TaxID=121402 RepID=A0A8T2P457_9TELE|nr:hypothetical protein JZ751_013591 [Albula glossodonta]
MSVVEVCAQVSWQRCDVVLLHSAELRWYEASSQLHGWPGNARNEHVSDSTLSLSHSLTLTLTLSHLLAHSQVITFILSYAHSVTHTLNHALCLTLTLSHSLTHSPSICVSFRGPGGRGPWPNPNANSIAYSSSSPGNYVGPPGGGGPPGTPIMPSPGDSTNSSENIYTMMNPIGPGGNRPNSASNATSHSGPLTVKWRISACVCLTAPLSEIKFPMGPGPDGPMGAMGAMEPHHMNGSLGSGDMDGLPKNSPNNMAGMNNPPGTPRDDGEMAGNFLNPFQSESVSTAHYPQRLIPPASGLLPLSLQSCDSQRCPQ